MSKKKGGKKAKLFAWDKARRGGLRNKWFFGRKSYVTLCGVDKITTQLNYKSVPRTRPCQTFFFFYLPTKKSAETCVNNVDNVIICISPRCCTIKIVKQFFRRREGTKIVTKLHKLVFSPPSPDPVTFTYIIIMFSAGAGYRQTNWHSGVYVLCTLLYDSVIFQFFARTLSGASFWK